MNADAESEDKYEERVESDEDEEDTLEDELLRMPHLSCNSVKNTKFKLENDIKVVEKAIEESVSSLPPTNTKKNEYLHKPFLAIHNQMVILEVSYQRDLQNLRKVYQDKHFKPLVKLQKSLLKTMTNSDDIPTINRIDNKIRKTWLYTNDKVYKKFKNDCELMFSCNEKPGKCYTNFWKNVILTSNLHFLIQTNELNMLDYLVDIATKSLNDIEIATSKDNQEEEIYGFKICFKFKPNPFFFNRKVFKIYHIDIYPAENTQKLNDYSKKNFQNSMVDTNVCLDYKGSRLQSVAGTKIEWKNHGEFKTNIIKSDKTFASIFEYFEYSWNEQISTKNRKKAEVDYSIGTYIYDNMVPNSFGIMKIANEKQLCISQPEYNKLCSNNISLFKSLMCRSGVNSAVDVESPLGGISFSQSKNRLEKEVSAFEESGFCKSIESSRNYEHYCGQWKQMAKYKKEVNFDHILDKISKTCDVNYNEKKLNDFQTNPLLENDKQKDNFLKEDFFLEVSSGTSFHCLPSKFELNKKSKTIDQVVFQDYLNDYQKFSMNNSSLKKEKNNTVSENNDLQSNLAKISQHLNEFQQFSTKSAASNQKTIQDKPSKTIKFSDLIQLPPCTKKELSSQPTSSNSPKKPQIKSSSKSTTSTRYQYPGLFSQVDIPEFDQTDSQYMSPLSFIEVLDNQTEISKTVTSDSSQDEYFKKLTKTLKNCTEENIEFRRQKSFGGLDEHPDMQAAASLTLNDQIMKQENESSSKLETIDTEDKNLTEKSTSKRKEFDCLDNSLQSSKRQKLESKEEEVKQ